MRWWVTAVQPFVVDASVAEHLEVLGLVPFGRGRVVEAVAHRDAVQRFLHHAVDHRRRRQLRRLEHGRGDVDDLVELAADLALGPDPVRPVDDGAVAGATPVGGDLLGPLVRGVHRVRPADRVVLYARGVPRSSTCSIIHSGVTRSGASAVMVSLVVPMSVPSADAPLSPMM
jgi:hypothetical protein